MRCNKVQSRHLWDDRDRKLMGLTFAGLSEIPQLPDELQWKLFPMFLSCWGWILICLIPQPASKHPGLLTFYSQGPKIYGALSLNYSNIRYYICWISNLAILSNSYNSTLVVPHCACVCSIRWYHGSLSRSEAESLLTLCKECSYLVRNSQTNRLDYSLSLR